VTHAGKARAVRRSIPASALAKASHALPPLPPPVEPQLWLVEEVVLLSLGTRAHYLRPVAKIAARAYPRGPRSHHAAVERLERKGLVGGRTATPAAHLPERRGRLVTVMERPAPPAGRDAELLAFLAATRALPLDKEPLRRQARQRLVSLRDPPPAVRALVDEFAVSTLEEFADKVLPSGVEAVEPVLDRWPSYGIGTTYMTP
jgi:hypothetical protein